MIRQLKYIAGIVAVGAFMASCSENDAPSPYDNPTKYISFGVPAINYEATVGDFAEGPKSRAALTETIDKFIVWGFCVPRGLDNQPNQSSAKKPWVEKSWFFTNGADLANLNKREVTLNGISTTYNDGNLTEWNEDDEALSSFIAVSGNVDCSMAVANNSTDAKHGPKLTVTLKTEGNSITTPLDYKAQPDALVAATFDRESGKGLVNMSFFHIMTGIRFKFNNFTEEKLVINEVTYAGKFFKEAEFDLTDDTPVMTVDAAKTYSGKFTLLAEPQTIDGESSDYVQTPSAYMGGDESPVTLLLLPNPAGTTADDNEYTLGTEKEITIKYTVANGPEHTFTLQNLLLNYKPLPNTLHTANFNFVGDKFVVMFQADDKLNWENGSDNEVIIK